MRDIEWRKECWEVDYNNYRVCDNYNDSICSLLVSSYSPIII